MNRYSLDMHLHSCLSPCGHEDMTPENIVNMALIKGLDMIAVADHNTAGNLPGVLFAAQETPLCVVPAMELETAEGVHVLAYFEQLKDCLACAGAVYEALPEMPNNELFFGPQVRMFAGEETGRETRLLVQSLALPIEEVFALVQSFGGVCVPAHINKESHGILGVLGFIPPDIFCPAVELFGGAGESFGRKVLRSSDAHQLGDIFEENTFTLPLPEKSAKAFVAYLKGE